MHLMLSPAIIVERDCRLDRAMMVVHCGLRGPEGLPGRSCSMMLASAQQEFFKRHAILEVDLRV